MNFNLIALTSWVVLLFFSHGIVASSIFQTIQNDKNICPTAADILKSKYFDKCNNVTYPVNMTVNWTKSNKDLFLCMAVYDRVFQICLTGTKLKLGSPKESILSNKTLFDNEMNKTITELKNNLTVNSDHALSICNSSMVHSPYPIPYNKTESYVKKLIEDPGNCVSSCYDSSTKTLNSFCLAINIIDKKIIEINKQLEINKEQPVNIPDTQITNDDNINQQNHNDQMPLPNSLEDSPTGDDYKLQEGKKDTKNNEKKSSVVMIENDANGKTEKSQNDLVSQKVEPSMKSNEATKVDETNTLSEFTQEIGNNESNPDVIQPDNNADDVLEHSDRDNELVVGVEETQTKPKSSSEKESLLIQTEEPVVYKVNLFEYLAVIGIACIVGCLVYHHKQKIMAIILEGRRSRGGRGRRRHSANYRKLDCNLEEAVNSQCDSNTTNVIY